MPLQELRVKTMGLQMPEAIWVEEAVTVAATAQRRVWHVVALVWQPMAFLSVQLQRPVLGSGFGSEPEWGMTTTTTTTTPSWVDAAVAWTPRCSELSLHLESARRQPVPWPRSELVLTRGRELLGWTQALPPRQQQQQPQ